MFEFIARGAGLAVSAALSPGPFQAFTISNTLAQGWRKGITVCVVPMIVDVPLIIFVVFVLGAVPADFLRVLQVVGGVFLLWLAYSGWRARDTAAMFKAREPGLEPDSATVPQITRWQILGRGALMGWLSPGPYLFWSTVNGPLLVKALGQSMLHGAAFLASFYGIFATILALTVLLADRLRYLDVRVTRAIMLATNLVLAVFGVSFIVQGIT
jgi:threonine/homoserine/homoserine lactone efflux protein